MHVPSDQNPLSQRTRQDGTEAHAPRVMLIGVTLILCAAAYSFHFTSFLHAKEIVLALSLTLAAAHAALRKEVPTQGLAAFAPLWGFLALSILFRLALFPAHVPSAAITEIARWAMLLLLAAFAYPAMANETARKQIANFLIFSACLVALLGLLQYAGLLDFLFPRFEGYTQRVYSVFGNQDLYGGYVVLGLPLVIAPCLRQAPRPRFPWIPLAILIPGLLISGCRSAWLAALAGIAISIPYRRLHKPRAGRLLAAAALLICATVLLAPEATTRRIKKTFAPRDEGTWARLWFWDGALRMFSEAPVIGVGLGHYAYWSPQFLGEAFYAPNGQHRFRNERYADHPHSDPIQILAEAGMAGTLCWLWMITRIIRAARRHPGKNASPSFAPAAGALTALIIFACFNRPSESAAHTLAGLLLASMLLAHRSPQPLDPKPSGPARTAAATALALLAAGLALFWGWAVLVPSCQLRAAEDAYLAGQPSLALYERVLRHPWPNYQAHKEYAIALADAHRENQACLEFQKALRGLDTGDIYLALALLAENRGDRQAARAWARQCLQRWPANADARELIR